MTAWHQGERMGRSNALERLRTLLKGETWNRGGKQSGWLLNEMSR